MTIKEMWTKTNWWLKSQRLYQRLHPEETSQADVDDEGLIAQDAEPAVKSPDAGSSSEVGENALVKTAQLADRHESLEKLQAGFDKLIENLKGINEHLNRQAAQHEELMRRIEQLPRLLEGFPALLENQKKTSEQLLEQLQLASARDERFVDAVEKIPSETTKQTDALVDIDHQLAAAADIDVQMAENFNKFHESLDRLNQSTMSQTDSIMQMGKTYATSERYLKYIISRHNKRFMWVFIAAVSVCVLVILILTGIIIYLNK